MILPLKLSAKLETRLFWLQAWEFVCVYIYINILYVASQLSLACDGPEGDTPRYSVLSWPLYHDPAHADAVLI